MKTYVTGNLPPIETTIELEQEAFKRFITAIAGREARLWARLIDKAPLDFLPPSVRLLELKKYIAALTPFDGLKLSKYLLMEVDNDKEAIY